MRQTLKTVFFLIVFLGMVERVLAVDAQLLVYRVSEPGLEPYFSRMIVTPEYVRLDEGGNVGDGYTLYERASGSIYNVSGEEGSVLQLRTLEKTPPAGVALKLEERVETDPDAPRVGGVRPVRVQLLVNGVVCRELMVVDGIMQPAIQGLKEFREALALFQAASLHTWPEASRTPCDLAELVYAPTRGLAHGLAVQDHSATMSQSLVDFEQNYDAAEELFVLPADYARIEMPDL